MHAQPRRGIRERGEEPLHCRAQHPADELDPKTIPMFIDEPDHLGQAGRAPSRKHARSLENLVRLPQLRDLPLKLLDPRGRLARDPLLGARIHLGLTLPQPQRFGLIPSSPATCRAALIMVGCDGRVSASIRNARSRISGEYFLFIVFHPCLKNGTKVRPIQPSSARPAVPAASSSSPADAGRPSTGRALPARCRNGRETRPADTPS